VQGEAQALGGGTYTTEHIGAVLGTGGQGCSAGCSSSRDKQVVDAAATGSTRVLAGQLQVAHWAVQVDQLGLSFR
jgi:hypothetical protein